MAKAAVAEPLNVGAAEPLNAVADARNIRQIELIMVETDAKRRGWAKMGNGFAE